MPLSAVYLDECANHRLVESLRARGFAVSTALTAGMLGTDDETQLHYAARHDLIIISHNKRHFQRWHATFIERGLPHGGIVLLPDSSFALLEVRAALMLAWVASLGEHRSRLFLWGSLQRELGGDLRLPGFSEAEILSALGRGT